MSKRVLIVMCFVVSFFNSQIWFNSGLKTSDMFLGLIVSSLMIVVGFSALNTFARDNEKEAKEKQK